jgi:hypothetical protein
MTVVSTSTFMVQNYEVWGKLVMTWATGVDHVKDPNNSYLPRPTTIADFAAMLAKAGVGATLPARFVNLSYAQSTQDTLVVRLPEAAVLTSVETQLAASPDAIWALPAFYQQEFGAQQMDPTLPLQHKLDLLAMRIGDYTIGVCAKP